MVASESESADLQQYNRPYKQNTEMIKKATRAAINLLLQLEMRLSRPKLDESVEASIALQGYDDAKAGRRENPYGRKTPAFAAYQSGQLRHAEEELRVW